ncbi:MAG: Cache 3/Cache 2 fusion domain-containing protein [Thiotrichaceae bacterium]
MFQITYALYQRILQTEVDSIYNEINASYQIIKSAGIADVESYVTSTQQKLLEQARHYSFGKSGFIFVFDQDASILQHPNYTAGQKLDFEFIRQILAQRQGLLTFEYQNQVYLAVFTYFPHWKWYIVLAITQQEVFEQNVFYLQLWLVFVILSFLFTLLLALLLIRLHFKWLPDVIAALRQIKNANLDTPIVVTHDDEIGIIQKTINMIMKKISELNMELIQYQKVLNNTIYGVCIFDAQNYKFLYINHNICHRLGYSESELLQMSPACVTAELEPENMTPRLQKLLSGEQSEFTIETVSYHKKGLSVPIKMTIYLFSPVPGEYRVICVMRDISQQSLNRRTCKSMKNGSRLALEVTNLMAYGKLILHRRNLF